MIRRPPRSTLFPYTTALPIYAGNARVVRLHGAPRRGKVGIVTGGGSGHEPAFLGYVGAGRSEEHTSELQSHLNIVCRLLLEKTIPIPLRMTSKHMDVQ